MNSFSTSMFRLVATIAALAILIPARAMGFVREASNWDPRSLPISYRVNTSSAPSSLGGATAQAAVDAAFASWAAPSCTSWSTINRGATTSVANASDGQNTVLWVSGSWPAALGDPSTTIGVTTTVWRSGGYFTDADIQFNNVRFSWSTTGTGGTVDTQSIAAHEEGHFLGLGHSTRAAAIMYPTYSGGLKRTLDSDDVNGVCTIYPYAGPMRDAGVADVTDVVATPDVFDAGSMMDVPPPALLGEDCSTQICDVGLTCLCSPGGRCVCGSSCSTSMPCPTGYSCAPTSGGSYCVRGGNTGDPCASSIDCNSGLCVNTGASSICSQACTDDCTCPAGYTCFPTTTGQTVCVPGARTCGPGPDASVTDTGAIDVVDARDVGVDVTYVGIGENCSANPCSPGLDCLCALTPYCVCAVECRSAPCDAPYSCQDTTAGPFCLPPGGGGAPCSSGLDCITGLCMTTATGGVCAPPCRDDCDCASGQQCYPSVNPGVNVCNVGDNQCGVVVDAGPPPDVGTPMDVVAAMDVASGIDAAADAGSPMDVFVAPDVVTMDAGSAEDIVVTGPDVVVVDAMGVDATTVDVAMEAAGAVDAGDASSASDVADAVARDEGTADVATGSDARDAIGDGGSSVRPAGCACRVPAHGATDSRAGWWMAMLAVVAVVRKKRVNVGVHVHVAVKARVGERRATRPKTAQAARRRLRRSRRCP